MNMKETLLKLKNTNKLFITLNLIQSFDTLKDVSEYIEKLKEVLTTIDTSY